MFESYLEVQKYKLDTEKLNLDGTHSLVKKSAQRSGYQYRKKGKTSNVLIMTDGKGIPIGIGSILKGNPPLPRESLRVVLPRANPFAWFYNLKY